MAANRFWYDIALSTSDAQLKALLATASTSNILYGSDFPYAPKIAIYSGLLQYSRFVAGAEGKQIGPAQLNANATRLLKKHAPVHGFLPEAQGDEQKEPEFGFEDSDDAREAREQLESS